jgi:hypothetical protein
VRNLREGAGRWKQREPRQQQDQTDFFGEPEIHSDFDSDGQPADHGLHAVHPVGLGEKSRPSILNGLENGIDGVGQ